MKSVIRRTRIVCTIGPSSSSPSVLRNLILAGMDVARLNFSHGDHETHRRAAADVRAAAAAVGRPIALVGDLQGPKIRTGELEASFQRLVRGRRVVLPAGPRIEPSDIEGRHQEWVDTVRKGDRVLLDDGRIELAVREKADGRATCGVVRGGLLGERKGVLVPGRTPPLPALTDKDLADLKLAVELGVDYVALSFVRKPQDVVECRNHIASLGSTAPVIAKLEKVEAIRELGQILEVAGAVMVARGDLGVELKLGELPAVQKEVIDHANRAGVPVITATEMLESMVTSNRPTRAEASDVANAVWDGTDAVMLSQETSIGAHPVEAVQAMARICLAAENHPSYQRHRPIWQEQGSVGNAIAHAVVDVARTIGARAIVAFTESGATALRVSKAYPSVPVIAASPYAEVLRRTALYSGVIPLEVAQGHDTDDMFAKASEAAIRSGLVRRGDRVAIVAGVPVGQVGNTNLLKVETVR